MYVIKVWFRKTASVASSFKITEMHLTESSTIKRLDDYLRYLMITSDENLNHLKIMIIWEMTNDCQITC